MWNSAGRAPSLRVLPWHLPYNGGKSTENLSQGKKNLSQVKKKFGGEEKFSTLPLGLVTPLSQST